jgi:hypothetical protein
MVKNLISSITPFGVATSFVSDKNYIISTAKTFEPAGFETVLKAVGVNGNIFLTSGAIGSRQSIQTHIAIARMAITLNQIDWNKENINDFSPNVIWENINKMDLNYDADTFKCEYCETFLSMSGLNYQSKKSGFLGKLFGF